MSETQGSPEGAPEEKSVAAGRRPGEKRCPRCGAGFVCGMAAGAERCWCADLPPAMPLPEGGAGCYCPDCLRAMIAARSPAA